MTFRSGGIASGLDTNTLISQLVSIERQPIVKLQTRQSTYEGQISKFGNLSAKLSDLKSALQKVDTKNELLALTASTSDDSFVTATATGDASPGSYSVSVAQLAKAEKDRSVAFTAADAPVKAGTLTFTVKDEDPVEITITDGDTLADVAASINASDAAVSASLVNDGTNTYLYLTADETGHTVGGTADDAIVVTEAYTGATGTELGITQVQAAQNARFTLDDLTIEKETNSVSDVVQGVTLNLKGAMAVDATPVSVMVSPDIDTVKKRLKDVVDAYNNVLGMLGTALTLEEDESREGTLAGDPVATRIQSSLQGIVSASISGLRGDFDSLGSMGIKTDSKGRLQIKDSELTDALESDFLGVSQLFTQKDTGLAAKMVEQIESFTDTHDGAIKSRQDGIRRSVDLLQEQIDRMNMRVDSYEQSLVRTYTALETMMSQLQFQGNYLSSTLG